MLDNETSASFLSKYNLGLYDLYLPHIHGETHSHHIKNNLLLDSIIPIDMFFDNYENIKCDIKNKIINFQTFILNYEELYGSFTNEFKGKVNALKNIAPYKLSIIKQINYKEYVFCINKTFWLKCFQRAWKKYYREKVRFYKNPKNILNRQICGNIKRNKLTNGKMQKTPKFNFY